MRLPQKELTERIKTVKESFPYLPFDTETIVQKETLAIVELESGEIREVKPAFAYAFKFRCLLAAYVIHGLIGKR